MPLSDFSAATRDWFIGAFARADARPGPGVAGDRVRRARPDLGADRIGKDARGVPVGIDRLAAEPRDGDRRIGLVYVSPLKALSYDIDRNLRTPLRGIGADLKVAVRTGDTPQRERQAMLREPPDILITTPESLYLMLTGRAQELFDGARWCIVDEIHAVAATKRGAHLALTLERLTERRPGATCSGSGCRPRRTRSRRSAASWSARGARCRIVDTGVRKELDLEIQVPVESMVEPDATPAPDLDPLAGGSEATRRSIWPAIYPELLELIKQHRSTILFVNNRRGAERVALRLNDLAGEDIARAHHGSLAREERTVVEEMLKAGELPCLVATSSLELGIDMGAVDLVIQVESPKSVARGLQRIGRAGHSVGDVSRGPDLPQVPRRPARVRRRRQADARRARSRRPWSRATRSTCSPSRSSRSPPPRPTTSRSPSTTCTRSSRARTPTPSSAARQLENVLDMLDGRYPSSEFAELRPRIVWDRIAGTFRARRAPASSPSPTPARSPTAACTRSRCPTAAASASSTRRWSTRRGPARRSCSARRTWRIEEIGRDRVIVTPAPGLPGAVPFWKGDGIGRPKELGEAIGAFARWAVDQQPEALAARLRPRPRAPPTTSSSSCASSRPPRGSSRRDRAIVVERFRDEIGDWRLCVLSPFGGRVHAAWGLALTARIREELGLESDAIWSDDGIIVHLPDAEEPPGRRPGDARARRDRGPRRRRAVGQRAVRRALSRERRARAADPAGPARQAHAAVAAAAQGAVAARGRQEVRGVPDRAGDLPRVFARRARRARPGRAADARCTGARSR